MLEYAEKEIEYYRIFQAIPRLSIGHPLDSSIPLNIEAKIWTVSNLVSSFYFTGIVQFNPQIIPEYEFLNL